MAPRDTDANASDLAGPQIRFSEGRKTVVLESIHVIHGASSRSPVVGQAVVEGIATSWDDEIGVCATSG